MTPARILIISASIGGGHVAAARALEQAFRNQGTNVRHEDMLEYTTKPFRRLYRQTYFDLVESAPDFVDWLGKRLDRRPGEQKSRGERARARLTRLISINLPRLIRRYKPDVLVHTHFFPPEILSTQGHKLEIPQAVVITDFAAHSLWLQPNIGRYFVATEEMAVHLQASGIEAARVRVSGIPIDPSFAALPSKEAARRKLGYAPERDLLLLMASGLELEATLELLNQLKAFKWPLSVAVVCGRSANLRDRLKAEVENTDGLVSFDILGFSKEVPTLMAASDLIVGKPGGLTSSESLAAGLPFAIVNPYPLQEEANTTYLLERGVAMRISPLTVFSYKLRRYLENAGERAAMRGRALACAKPQAASDVADSLLNEPVEG